MLQILQILQHLKYYNIFYFFEITSPPPQYLTLCVSCFFYFEKEKHEKSCKKFDKLVAWQVGRKK